MAESEPRARFAPLQSVFMPVKTRHLIGAHGLFWERDAIDWDAPRGQTHQLLGYRYGPTYVGQARGSTDGIGYRLKAHDRDGFKDWNRFCWFSFDNVAPSFGYPGWCDVVREENARSVGAPSAINDLEALMIVAFGLRSQNQMRLAGSGRPWKQLTADDCLPGGTARKVDTEFIRMQSLRKVLELDRAGE